MNDLNRFNCCVEIKKNKKFFFLPRNICITFIIITPSVRRFVNLALNHLLRISQSHEREICCIRLHANTAQKWTKAPSVSLEETVDLCKRQQARVCVEEKSWGSTFLDLRQKKERNGFRRSRQGGGKNEGAKGRRRKLAADKSPRGRVIWSIWHTKGSNPQWIHAGAPSLLHFGLRCHFLKISAMEKLHPHPQRLHLSAISN